MKKQTFLEGTAVLAASALIVKIIGAFFRIPLTSLLGGTGMGYYSCAAGIFLPVYAVTATGLPSAAARLVSKDIALNNGVSFRKIKRIALLLFGGAGTAGTLLILAAAYPFCRYAVNNMPALPSVVLIAPSVAAGCFSAVLRGCFEGKGDMRPTALSQVAEAINKLAFGLAGAYFVMYTADRSPERFLRLIRYRGDMPDRETIAGLAACTASAAACAAVTVSCFAGLGVMAVCDILSGKRQTFGSLETHWDVMDTKSIISELASVAFPAALCALVTDLTSVIDMLTIMNSLERAVHEAPELYSGCGCRAEEIPNFMYGCFSGMTVTVFNLVPSVTNMLGRSIMPSAAASCGDRRRLAGCVTDVVLISEAAAMPCGFGIMALSEPILTLLFPDSPSAVSAAAEPLSVMSVGMILLCVSAPLFSVFQAAGRSDIPVKLMAAGAAAKAAGNILLVPVPQLGLTGAAISTDISYALICVLAFSKLRIVSDTNIRQVLRMTCPILLCGMICGTAARTAYVFSRCMNGFVSTVFSILFGALFYIISTYFFISAGKSTFKMTISQKKFKNT